VNTVKASTVTPQEFIDSGGLKARHWLVFGVIALVLMADGMDITIVSHVFPSLVKEWGATGTQITFIVTVSFIGMGLGAIIGGRMADRFGRKILTVLSLILLGVTTIAMATAPNMEMFIFWRIVSSLGLGGVMPVIMTLLADLVPSANRGQLVAIVSAGIGLGTTFGAFLAGAVIPDSGWRTLMTICGIIPLALIIPFLALVPESPAWLAARGSYGPGSTCLGETRTRQSALDSATRGSRRCPEKQGGVQNHSFATLRGRDRPDMGLRFHRAWCANDYRAIFADTSAGPGSRTDNGAEQSRCRVVRCREHGGQYSVGNAAKEILPFRSGGNIPGAVNRVTSHHWK